MPKILPFNSYYSPLVPESLHYNLPSLTATPQGLFNALNP